MANTKNIPQKSIPSKKTVTVDGSDATVHVAYRCVDVCAIFPITPSSVMSEQADVWATNGIKNIWGQVPEIVELQSEAGVAGTTHGALQTGSLSTTFTSSQGLLLMLPNMYKIAGELTSAVFHIAARSLAAQGLSIFGDHQDVMSARMTGFAMLSSSDVQENQDLAVIAHASTLKSRIPFMHFFDGFRTSHEINSLVRLSNEEIHQMIDDDLVFAHRRRGLSPDNPFIRGTAQNPDTYFQGRESVNVFYDKAPAIVQNSMDKFAALTGRQYRLFDYDGDPDAERIIILIGSASHTATKTSQVLNDHGEKTGVVTVRLYRPFSIEHFAAAIPVSVKAIAVLDRTKEPGARGEPLYLDVVEAIFELLHRKTLEHTPLIIGGRYGLSSKEFTPAMAKAVFDELKKEQPQKSFTIGINDDVTHRSIEFDPSWEIESDDVTRAIFYGLGSDGTVGANKNSIKIIGEYTDLYAQGYFVYDSNKAGSQTVSHLRFGPEPISAPYLITSANFIACHKFSFVERWDMLKCATQGATFLLNSPYSADQVWNKLPRQFQQDINSKKMSLYVIDAAKVAKKAGMGKRINTVMQVCFFALFEILPTEEAIGHIKDAIRKSYLRKGEDIVEKNYQAVDGALENLQQVNVPDIITSDRDYLSPVDERAPDFVKNITARMIKGEGNELPVSLLPNDGTFPSGTSKWAKKNLSDEVPIWEPDVCIQCGNCVFVCPHSVIRAKFYHQSYLENAPETFKSAPISSRGYPDIKYTLQIYAEDCTGCGVCVEACPALAWPEKESKAINMRAKAPVLEAEVEATQYFDALPINDRAEVDFSSVRGVQYLEPLFEFSSACAGCGETPYLKLLSQLFGPRLLIANATGCSSIYGGNLPTTPWTKNAEGRGPAWSNSLFEDNAEFGLGMRISADKHLALAKSLLSELREEIGEELVHKCITSKQQIGAKLRRQRDRVSQIKEILTAMDSPQAKTLLTVVDHLVRRSVWIVGGDGWAYDIGSAGLDHVLASGRNVNILVMDTEVYSNTGGQQSKATPTAASAKFATGGKSVGKKDLALQAVSYGNVYVARVAMGSNSQQTLLAFREAEEYPGTSIILAFSPCIEHGYDLRDMLEHQNQLVETGYWPLMRYNPALRKVGGNPFVLDSPRPRIKFKDYAYTEMRYKSLTKSNPERAEHLMDVAQELVELKWDTYEKMAAQTAEEFHPVG